MPAPTAVTVLAKPGKDAYAYSNSGSYGTPTWTTQGNIKDLTSQNDNALSEQTIRSKRPHKVWIYSCDEYGVKFKMVWIPTDELCVALLAARANKTAIDMIFLDGPIATAGSQGPRADWVVGNMPRTENLADGMEIDVELKPGLTANVPSWYVAS